MRHTCHQKISIGLLVFNSKCGPFYHYWLFFIGYLIYLFKMIFFNDINNVIIKVLLCFKISFCLFFFFFSLLIIICAAYFTFLMSWITISKNKQDTSCCFAWDGKHAIIYDTRVHDDRFWFWSTFHMRMVFLL